MTPPHLGYPERWAAFSQRHARFISDCYPVLLETSQSILNRGVSIKSLADDVMFLLGRTAFEDYCEIWVLAGNGFGIGAYKILRGLYEKVVTLGYLMKHQSEVQKFVDYQHVRQRKLVKCVRENIHLRDQFTEAEYEKIEQAYQAVKGQFTREGFSWSPLSTLSMAEQAGYDLHSISVSGYVLPNLKIHATANDLAERKAPQGDGTFKFDNEPQEQYADSALLTGTYILIAALFIHDDYFQLGKGSEIEEVQINLARSWPMAPQRRHA